jgi:hypothetical protein
MKTRRFSPPSPRILTLSAALVIASMIPTRAGIIDLLRGNSQPDQQEFSCQRVAFVGSADVKVVEGNAVRLSGIDRWTPLRAGSEIIPGDIIRSGEGFIILRMKESDSFVKVTPHTVLRLVPLKKGWDRSVLSGREERRGFLVRSCRGKAEIQVAGDWKGLAVNTVLSEGALIQIGAESTVDLFAIAQGRPVRIKGPARITLNPSVISSRTLNQPALASAGPIKVSHR